MKLKSLLLLFITVCICSLSRAQVKVGQWVDHLSYKYANSVSKLGNTVYVSNGSGVVRYNLGDNSLEKYTKIDGLSDVGVQLLRKNNYNNTLMVIYDNTNIDIITADGTITNISDIKRKVITGKKSINEVYFNANLAYIACGFGIVVFDTDKLEIKDTYYVSNGITNYEIFQVTKNDTAFFVSTNKGIFYGNKFSNLNNYQNWKPLNIGLPVGFYNSIVNFDNKIITSFSEFARNGTPNKDTIYQYDGVSWSKYPHKAYPFSVRKLYDGSQYNRFYVLEEYGRIQDFNPAGASSIDLQYYSSFDLARINDIYYDGGNQYWFADQNYGLADVKTGSSFSSIIINGPENNFANDIDIKDGILVVAPVNLGVTYANQYLQYSANIYQNKEWGTLKYTMPSTIRDINTVAIDPNDNKHIAFACMDKGVVVLKNLQYDKTYNCSNSPMTGYNNDSTLLWSTGVSFDKNSNLWALISGSNKIVQVLKTNGSWVGLNFQQLVNQATVPKVIFDKYDQAWFILARGGGLMVYRDVNGLSQPNTSNTKLVTTTKGSGGLATPEVRSICEDLDGHIWVGTAKGVTVFYNPENVFSGSNWDSQQILIEQDGHVQILLENDIVTAIAVDGANRKWIGTQTSGVYCFSPDGQKQIYHFTAENSPLYSDDIKDIVTDETTGDVFIASEIGIQSFRTAIIKGFENFENVHAYPNPVRPGFSGPVYITGLIDEAVVKITDVAGNLVWETKSEGGQVEWDLHNFSGARAASGVYMIYCASADGGKSATAKLLIIN